jgi:hypothetical protein
MPKTVTTTPPTRSAREIALFMGNPFSGTG